MIEYITAFYEKENKAVYVVWCFKKWCWFFNSKIISFKLFVCEKKDYVWGCEILTKSLHIHHQLCV